jgi:hypothetical protein
LKNKEYFEKILKNSSHRLLGLFKYELSGFHFGSNVYRKKVFKIVVFWCKTFKPFILKKNQFGSHKL